MEGLTGFEPVLKVLQTHALPLGYSPKNKLIVHYFLKHFNIFSKFYVKYLTFIYKIYIFFYKTMSKIVIINIYDKQGGINEEENIIYINNVNTNFN